MELEEGEPRANIQLETYSPIGDMEERKAGLVVVTLCN